MPNADGDCLMDHDKMHEYLAVLPQIPYNYGGGERFAKNKTTLGRHFGYGRLGNLGWSVTPPKFRRPTPRCPRVEELSRNVILPHQHFRTNYL